MLLGELSSGAREFLHFGQAEFSQKLPARVPFNNAIEQSRKTP
jgi:hypothetical protein